MIYTVTEESGTKGLEQLAGSSSTGTPLGTWASFENDYAPNIEWLQGGTTFNPNTYPALAMYLGGNTVPERYDHDRPSEWETITLPTTSATAITMQYDGILSANLGSSSAKAVYVNGVRVTNGTTLNAGLTFNVEFKKGDTIYVTGSITEQSYVKYYKHPLFIKATPTSSDSDYEGTLNGIRTYVENSNSYSTEEVWTGGYWIDGKKIYRKVYDNGSWVSNLSIDVSNLNIETLIYSNAICRGNSDGTGVQCVINSTSGSTNKQMYINASNVLVTEGNLYKRYVTIEYTKTTD